MSTITIRLPDDVAEKIKETEINGEQLNSFLVSAVNAWLLRRQSIDTSSPEMIRHSWTTAFQDSAVPFAVQLIDENRALFEELAQL